MLRVLPAAIGLRILISSHKKRQLSPHAKGTGSMSESAISKCAMVSTEATSYHLGKDNFFLFKPYLHIFFLSTATMTSYI